ncbi:MAG TPA: hypothetical protein VGV40_03805 [Solirubrobacteraceae bacterium]|nr:hypothetical protein [Solirubrobacteraceae bacterium]
MYSPTGAAYTVAGARETSVEKLPTVNARELVEAVDVAVAKLENPTQTLSGNVRNPTVIEYLLAARRRSHTSKLALFLDKLNEPLLAATPYTLDPFAGSSALIGLAEAEVGKVEREDGDEEHAPPAFHAFKDLGKWLDADDGEVAQMVGFGRTTPYSWKRSGAEPRVGTVQRLYEYHATLDSLHRRLGDDGLRRWLHLGAPSTRRETLLAGRLEELEHEVHELLFRRAPESRLDLAAAPEDAGAVGARQGQAPHASRRRPRRPAG